MFLDSPVGFHPLRQLCPDTRLMNQNTGIRPISHEYRRSYEPASLNSCGTNHQLWAGLRLKSHVFMDSLGKPYSGWFKYHPSMIMKFGDRFTIIGLKM